MVMYEIIYTKPRVSSIRHNKVTVIATSITHALDLIELAYGNNIDIIECKFIKRYDNILIEDTSQDYI